LTGSSYRPRNLPLAELIKTLVAEHGVMQEGIERIRKASDHGDFEEVSKALKDLDEVFRQHITDEEAQILRLLVAELGAKGAEKEIMIFQQHRPIYGLMQTISELASKEAKSLASENLKLARLFDDHTKAEEERVFPRSLELSDRAS